MHQKWIREVQLKHLSVICRIKLLLNTRLGAVHLAFPAFDKPVTSVAILVCVSCSDLGMQILYLKNLGTKGKSAGCRMFSHLLSPVISGFLCVLHLVKVMNDESCTLRWQESCWDLFVALLRNGLGQHFFSVLNKSFCIIYPYMVYMQ